MATAFTGAYNSFSGVDIKAVFGNVVIGELQGVSYSITREKAPVYTMGSADPRSFSRGKRGIAGTLIFVVFDRHALLGVMGAFAREGIDVSGIPKFLSDIDDIRPDVTQVSGDQTTIAAANAIRAGEGSTRQIGSSVETQETLAATVGGDQRAVLPWYADQILPFDITLGAANEYGALAVMRVYGCEILNEGMGVSIDDLQTAQQTTYVARMVVGWQSLGRHSEMQALGTANTNV